MYRWEREIRREQQVSAVEELNLLMKGRLDPWPEKRHVHEPDEFAEDGFAFDDDDPLEYIDQDQARAPGEEYEVVYKAIAIRKHPNTQAKVYGRAVCGDTFATFGWDETMTWRKIHYKLRGGWGSLVAAWVMVLHDKLGVLTRPVAQLVAEEKLELPTQPAQADPSITASALSAAELDQVAAELSKLTVKGANPEFTYPTASEIEAAAELGGLQYRVVHTGRVYVRSLPGAKGKVVGAVKSQDFIDTFGWDEKKRYRKMYCRLNDGSRHVIVGWTLVEQAELGPLLEVAAG